MRNLLEETEQEIKENGKTIDDVKWVGTPDAWMTWDEFALIADIEYNEGPGGQAINPDLVVVGEDWWLERVVHNLEWWEFKKLPEKPSTRANGTKHMRLMS